MKLIDGNWSSKQHAYGGEVQAGGVALSTSSRKDLKRIATEPVTLRVLCAYNFTNKGTGPFKTEMQ